MTVYKKRNLFNRYKHDPLFRQWLPTLGILSRAGQGNEVDVWYETKRALRRIKQKTDWRDAEVHFFYTELNERYPSMPVFCLAVMAVLFVCLTDAAPATDHTGENPYASACVAIYAMLGGDRCFQTLVNDFFSRRNFRHKKDPDSRKGRAAPLPKTKERKNLRPELSSWDAQAPQVSPFVYRFPRR